MSSVQSADSSSVGRGLSSIRLIARAVCMKPKWVKIGCVSMLVSLGCVLVAGVLVLFNWDTLAVQNARYDRVLKRARTLTSHTHETVYFRGDWNFDPAGLPEDNNICARRLQDGSMFVRIGVGSRIFSVDLLPGTNGFTPAVEGRGGERPGRCLACPLDSCFVCVLPLLWDSIGLGSLPGGPVYVREVTGMCMDQRPWFPLCAFGQFFGQPIHNCSQNGCPLSETAEQSLRPQLAPNCLSTFATVLWPCFFASDNGVPPQRSVGFNATCRLTRKFTTSRCPSAAARCSGVRPS